MKTVFVNYHFLLRFVNMSTLHIVNANFEAELEGRTAFDLEHSFGKSPILFQLQFLPCLYAHKDDGIGVSMRSHTSKNALHLLSDPQPLSYHQVESWGYSQMIARWAKNRGLTYRMPPWEVVKTVNSKAFSFQGSPQLPRSVLISSEEEARRWMKSFEGEKVFKNCFGVSGGGHVRIPHDHHKLVSFLRREFHKKLPVIAEPWVKRSLDFSTQWIIHSAEKIEYVGSTICLNDERGKYSGNQTGDVDLLFGKNRYQLDKHLEIAKPILYKMGHMGFFGHVGIDAMLYNDDVLHPIVEINARKTMGWFCIQMQKRYFPKQLITVSYGKNGKQGNLLPHVVSKPSGDTLAFSTHLTIRENQNGYTEN
jgi:hypothetical protein